MLVELRVRDFVVIDEATTRLGSGLNILTGETGAGKSILVGALSLLLGERASSDSVRAGAERAVVEAVFDLARRQDLRQQVFEAGYDTDDDFLILRREVWLEGRNRAWVNGSPAPAGVVGTLGRALVDLHGQHEHQTLLRGAEQRRILDAHGGSTALAEGVARLHSEWSELREERERRDRRQGELEAQADFLRFQVGEIEGAAIQEGEDGALEEEGRRLEHGRELAEGSEALHRALYAEDDSLADRLSALRSLAGDLARIDPGLEEGRDELEELYHRVTELGRSMGSYSAGVEGDPARLEEIRRRLDHLARLKRKYGSDLASVVEAGERMRRELDELDGGDLELRDLERRSEAVRAELEAKAEELSGRRRASAEGLEEAVQEILPALGMEGARFQVEFGDVDEVGPGGRERIEFLVSLNPGFDPRPLSKVASGGELSRVMLALKTILSREDQVPTLVFDEIDAGVGGVVAGQVAKQLRSVAARHQVLVITHLAQIASMGDRHLRVVKEEREGLAAVSLQELDGAERVEELARLLGGDPDSATSRDHARELLARASSPR